MQLHTPASERAGRGLGAGVAAVVAALMVLLTGCQPREGLAPTSADKPGAPGAPISATPVYSGKPLTIVALGDSFSSGEGNAPFDRDAAGCDRSSNAWPRLLGQRLAGSTVRVIACAGAKTTALTSSFKGQPPQLTALRSLIAAGVKPDLVTLTIGGNDAGFGPTIASCVVWRCFWTGHDDHSREYVTDTLPPLLQTAYSQVREAAAGARVIVVGYPALIPSRPDNTCRWLGNNERVQLTGLNNDLNRVIRRAASRADVDFLSIDHAFDGHKLCTQDPWVYPAAISGAGFQATGHPNAAGQRAIADAAYAYLAKGR